MAVMIRMRPRTGRGAVRSFTRRQPLAQFPIISRGLPFSASTAGGFGDTFAEANAIDADYGTTWRSITSPNGGTAQWYVLDLRGLLSKANVWFHWKNPTMPWYQAAIALGTQAGSPFNSVPCDYKLQGHTSSGAQPAVGDVGWVDLVTVTNNRYTSRVHTGLNLSTYNWFRFYCTRATGASGNDDVVMQFDLRDASPAGATNDSFFFYGDSITSENANDLRPDRALWVNIGPLGNALQARTGRYAPVIIDGGVGGWTAALGDTNKADYIGTVPCRYCTIAFGTNEAHNAAIDLSTAGGTSNAFVVAYKASMQSIIDYAAGLGKLCIVPHVPWRDANPSDGFSPQNVVVLNQAVDQLVAANVGKAIAGPDFYPLYQAHPELLRTDVIHPTWDNTVGAGMFGGLTGHEWMLQLWRDMLVGAYY